MGPVGDILRKDIGMRVKREVYGGDKEEDSFLLLLKSSKK